MVKVKITKIPNKYKRGGLITFNDTSSNYAGILADGGPVNLGGYHSNGSDWETLLTLFNVKNTHENNGNEGILLGVDLNGTPNLVEGGETKWEDYIFSHRLTIPTRKELQEEFKNLPDNEGGDSNRGWEIKMLMPYAGMNYADASKKAFKDAEERPNDPIARRGLETILTILRDNQEQERALNLELDDKVKAMNGEPTSQEEQMMEEQLAQLEQAMLLQLQEEELIMQLLQLAGIDPQLFALMPPEQLQLILQQLVQLVQQLLPSPEEQVMMEQLMAAQQGMAPEQMAAMLQQGLPMMANGGLLYAQGGFTNDALYKKFLDASLKFMKALGESGEEEHQKVYKQYYDLTLSNPELALQYALATYQLYLKLQLQALQLANYGYYAEGGELSPEEMAMQELMMLQLQQAESIPPQEQQPQEPVEEESNTPNFMNLLEDPEDMSTKDLNDTIKEIQSYAKETGDKQLARDARKALKAKRDAKIDFIIDAIEDIKEEQEEVQLQLMMQDLALLELLMQELQMAELQAMQLLAMMQLQPLTIDSSQVPTETEAGLELNQLFAQGGSMSLDNPNLLKYSGETADEIRNNPAYIDIRGEIDSLPEDAKNALFYFLVSKYGYGLENNPYVTDVGFPDYTRDKYLNSKITYDKLAPYWNIDDINTFLDFYAKDTNDQSPYNLGFASYTDYIINNTESLKNDKAYLDILNEKDPSKKISKFITLRQKFNEELLALLDKAIKDEEEKLNKLEDEDTPIIENFTGSKKEYVKGLSELLHSEGLTLKLFQLDINEGKDFNIEQLRDYYDLNSKQLNLEASNWIVKRHDIDYVELQLKARGYTKDQYNKYINSTKDKSSKHQSYLTYNNFNLADFELFNAKNPSVSPSMRSDIINSLKRLYRNKGINPDNFTNTELNLFEALMVIMNNGNETIKHAPRMRKVIQNTVGNIQGKTKWTAEFDDLNKAQHSIKELMDEFNDSDLGFYGLHILAANRSVDLITLIFTTFVDYCKSEQDKKMGRIQLELLKLRDLHAEKFKGSTDTEWMFELYENGDLTGNIVTELDWGRWEQEHEAFETKLKSDFFNAHKEEMANMTAIERSNWMLKELAKDRAEWIKDHCEPADPDIPLSYNGEADFTEKLIPKKSMYQSELWKKLSLTQLLFINQYLYLKKQLDACVEDYRPGATILHRAPLFRGNVVNRFRHTKQGQNAFTRGKRVVVEILNETFFEDCLDTDFGDNSTYNNVEDIFADPMSLSREANLRLPVYGINKLTNYARTKGHWLSSKDNTKLEVVDNTNALSTDIFYSTMMYAGMATNVEALQLAGSAAFSGMYSLNFRKVNGVEEYIRGARGNHSNIFKRFTKYVEMLVFNIYSDKTPISTKGKKFIWEKFVKTISGLWSLKLLSGKSNSAFVNTGTGLTLIHKECMVGEHFNWKEYREAQAIYWKYVGKACSDGSLMRYSQRYHSNKFFRFCQFMDATNKNSLDYRELETTIPVAMRLSWGMHWYETGDHMMQSVPYLAKALHTKLYVLKPGQDVTDEELRLLDLDDNFADKFTSEYKDSEGKTLHHNIWEAFDETTLNDQLSIEDETAGNPYLGTYFIKNADGTFERWNRVSLSRFMDDCRMLVDDLHGVYNNKDASAATQNAFIASMFVMKKYFLGYSNTFWLTSRESFTRKEDITGAFDALRTLWCYNNLEDKWRNVKLAGLAAPLIGVMLTNPIVMHSTLLPALFGSIYVAAGTYLSNSVGWKKNLRKEGFSKSQVAALARLNATIVAFLIKSIPGMLIAKGIIPPKYDDEGYNTNKDLWIAEHILGLDNVREDMEYLKSRSNAKDPGFLYTLIMRNYLDLYAPANETEEEYYERKKDEKYMYYILGMINYFSRRLSWEQQVANPITTLLDPLNAAEEGETQLHELANFVMPTWVSAFVDTQSLFFSAFKDFDNKKIIRDKNIKTLEDLAYALNISLEEFNSMNTALIIKRIYNSDWAKDKTIMEIWGTLKYIGLSSFGNDFLDTFYEFTPGIINEGFWTSDPYKSLDRYRMGRKG